jgi:hypothetical protein
MERRKEGREVCKFNKNRLRGKGERSPPKECHRDVKGKEMFHYVSSLPQQRLAHSVKSHAKRNLKPKNFDGRVVKIDGNFLETKFLCS